MNKDHVLEAIDQIVALNDEAAETFIGITARNNQVLRKLGAVLAEPDKNTAPDLLSYEQAAKYLNIPIGTLYNWKHYRRIPFTQVNGKVRFERSELDLLLSGGKSLTKIK